MKRWVLAAILAIGGIPIVSGFSCLGYELLGKSAFTSWRASRVAMGDRLDWKSLEPPAVAPADNFAEAPLIRGAILDKDRMDPRWKALTIPDRATPFWGDWHEGRRDDLANLCQAYGAKDPWSALEPLAPTLKELDLASRRSGSRLPVDYQEGQVPGLWGFRAAVRTLRFRAIANLRNGRQDLALADVLTCMRMARHFEREPGFLPMLLRSAILKLSMQVVWEGLEDHLWSASQLEQLQLELAKTNLLATMRLAWQGERQNCIELFSASAENRPVPKYLDREIHGTKLGRLGSGWFYRNLVIICQYFSAVVDTLDPPRHRVFPTQLPDPADWERRLRFRPDLLMARIALPGLTGTVINGARNQALIDESVVVCALERYRIKEGHYPDRLETLAPGYLQDLPADLVTGSPMHYRRQGATFLLYQVGWGARDENGRIAWTGTGKDRKIDPAQGDWTWPHAH